MGETTGITWTDMTFNPWIGCTKVSEGCKLCYAETQNKRYGWTAGWGKGAPRKRTSAANWKKPLEWARQAVKDGITRRVFCASLADVFDAEVDPDWRDDLWKLMHETALIGGLEWLVLTKRPENIVGMTPNAWLYNQPDWVRIGVTAENQENADKRIPQLLNAWRGKNFISYEPALGPIDFSQWMWPLCWHWDAKYRTPEEALAAGAYAKQKPQSLVSANCMFIDWLICGGESGAGCRPMNLEWARSVRDQCKQAGVPFFMKQLGGFPDKRHVPAEWPEDLRIQEFPE